MRDKIICPIMKKSPFWKAAKMGVFYLNSILFSKKNQKMLLFIYISLMLYVHAAPMNNEPLSKSLSMNRISDSRQGMNSNITDGHSSSSQVPQESQEGNFLHHGDFESENEEMQQGSGEDSDEDEFRPQSIPEQCLILYNAFISMGGSIQRAPNRQNCCDDDRINCRFLGEITSIYFANEGLRGTIDHKLANLSHLQTL